MLPGGGVIQAGRVAGKGLEKSIRRVKRGLGGEPESDKFEDLQGALHIWILEASILLKKKSGFVLYYFYKPLEFE